MVDFKSSLIAVGGNGTFGIPYVGEESFVTFFFTVEWFLSYTQSRFTD